VLTRERYLTAMNSLLSLVKEDPRVKDVAAKINEPRLLLQEAAASPVADAGGERVSADTSLESQESTTAETDEAEVGDLPPLDPDEEALAALND
ncbi:MAG: hypothetical protein MK135_11525, partial [Polyangiaceae bacterium]|nr:hypothetical protein [Polyangiaceae bacterium]